MYRAGNVGHCISGMMMPVSFSSSYSAIEYNLFVVKVARQSFTYRREYHREIDGIVSVLKRL